MADFEVTVQSDQDYLELTQNPIDRPRPVEVSFDEPLEQAIIDQSSTQNRPNNLPEMPVSHPNVDVKEITKDGLIQACKHFAELAKHNPELANSQADAVVQWGREEASLRQRGLDDNEIKKSQWASMRERHRNKMGDAEKSGPKHQTTDTTNQETAVTESRYKELAPDEIKVNSATLNHSAVINKLENTNNQQPITDNAPWLKAQETAPLLDALTATERSISKVRTENNRSTKSSERINSGTSVLVYDRQSKLSESARQTFVDEAVKTERPAVENTRKVVIDTESIDKKTASTKQLIAEQLTIESLDEETPIEPANSETILINNEAEAEDGSLANTSASDKLLEIEAAPDMKQIAIFNWSSAIGKEPVQLYQDFGEALSLLIGLYGEQFDDEHQRQNTDKHEDGLTNLDESHQELRMPPIATKVTESLSVLEDKDKSAIASVLMDIAIAIHDSKLGLPDSAEPETSDKLEAQLEVLVILLLERLGLDYKTSDIEQFITLLLRPEFQTAQTEIDDNLVIDLENDGTREAKRQTSTLNDGLTGFGLIVHELLGQLILYYLIGNRSSSLQPAFQVG